MFDVGRSMFDVHWFLFRSDLPLFRLATGLTPGTLNLYPFTETAEPQGG
jgi:hypothetical protein